MRRHTCAGLGMPMHRNAYAVKQVYVYAWGQECVELKSMCMLYQTEVDTRTHRYACTHRDTWRWDTVMHAHQLPRTHVCLQRLM